MPFSVTTPAAHRSRRVFGACVLLVPTAMALFVGTAGLLAQAPAKQAKPAQQIKEDVKGAEKAADQGGFDAFTESNEKSREQVDDSSCNLLATTIQVYRQRPGRSIGLI